MPKSPPRFLSKPAESLDEVEQQLTPEMLSRQDFARRLQRLMKARGWNQAELAKHAFGTITDRRGYETPQGKDSVSGYLAGKRMPGPKKLSLLARALGVEPEELLPNIIASAAENEHLSFSMRELAGHPGRVWVTINRLLPTSTALKIGLLIEEADMAMAASG
ncbi:protein of unknown function(Lambda repressor-like, DNA-binding domain,33-105) [Magnetospirillum sp. XM-1]|uniref:helix-turn-helix domain-containing protein n=1 Tax=Magnetospirillum sp. XM-1 TaxID=1663591 RepID=UPI00073E04F4|nr:helix-turn-helix domain-containing protein [Magnetospirillum sp. XM-1]CUW38827.1 protein of unknown function(Lambda repressor-like, DNA-binding domain,33-105) [Magnetospirillum sp. XM-1]